MASYAEIAGLLGVNDASGLREKVTVAAFVKADAARQVADDGSLAVRQQKRFAQLILKQTPNQSFVSRNDGGFAATILEAIYRGVLIANKDATLTQIQNATDTQIQNAVNSVFDFLAASYPDPATP